MADFPVLYHHPSKQQASALAKAEIRAREQAVADEKRRLGLHDQV
jgi:pre-mRNA branch site protein p14